MINKIDFCSQNVETSEILDYNVFQNALHEHLRHKSYRRLDAYRKFFSVLLVAKSGLCWLLLDKSAILDKETDVTHFLIQRSSKWIYSIFSYFIFKIYDLRHFIEKQNCNLGK